MSRKSSRNDHKRAAPAVAAALPQPNSQNNGQKLIAQHWSGALPPPAALADFDKIIDNGAERIMAMSEREQAHRHTMEQLTAKAEIEAVQRAQLFELASRTGGFVALLACVAGSIYLARNDHTAVAIALVSVPVMSAIGWLISRNKAPKTGE